MELAPRERFSVNINMREYIQLIADYRLRKLMAAGGPFNMCQHALRIEKQLPECDRLYTQYRQEKLG